MIIQQKLFEIKKKKCNDIYLHDVARTLFTKI